jgi:hypothetical protein
MSNSLSRSISNRSISKMGFAFTTLLLAFAGTACAQTESETFGTYGYFGCALDNSDFYVPAFNPALGTLEDVDVTLSFRMTPTITVFNTTNAPIKFTDASITVPVEISGLGLTTFDTTLTASYSGTARPGTNNDLLGQTRASGTEAIAPSDFSSWEDQPTQDKVNFTLSKGDPSYQGTAQGDGLLFGGSDAQFGKISVQYTYLSAIAAPEPSGRVLSIIVGLSMMLIILGRTSRHRA